MTENSTIYCSAIYDGFQSVCCGTHNSVCGISYAVNFIVNKADKPFVHSNLYYIATFKRVRLHIYAALA